MFEPFRDVRLAVDAQIGELLLAVPKRLLPGRLPGFGDQRAIKKVCDIACEAMVNPHQPPVRFEKLFCGLSDIPYERGDIVFIRESNMRNSLKCGDKLFNYGNNQWP
jgi:hypothetical protein